MMFCKVRFMWVFMLGGWLYGVCGVVLCVDVMVLLVDFCVYCMEFGVKNEIVMLVDVIGEVVWCGWCVVLVLCYGNCDCVYL